LVRTSKAFIIICNKVSPSEYCSAFFDRIQSKYFKYYVDDEALNSSANLAEISKKQGKKLIQKNGKKSEILLKEPIQKKATTIKLLVIFQILTKNLTEVLTVYGIHLMEEEIKSKIKQDYGDEYSFDEKYSKIIFSAATMSEWGNEYHILAMSTVLNKDIFIYAPFVKHDDLKRVDITRLSEEYNKFEKLFGFLLEVHADKKQQFRAMLRKFKKNFIWIL
jgi:hypothetical protein